MTQTDCIFLTILTPVSTLLEIYVSKVELPGTKGRFMVLKNHSPLISSLAAGCVKYTAGGKEGNVRISTGFVEVNENKITVCAEL